MVSGIASKRKKFVVVDKANDGNKQSMPDCKVLGVAGRDECNKGGVIASLPQNPVLSEKNEVVDDLEIIDAINFSDGKNGLSIKLLKKPNRIFQIKVFFNDSTEIRPITFNGSSPAMSFWKLLKGTIEKDEKNSV